MMLEADPLIVIGMHRSGTSLVSRLLMRFGVRMGARREANDEATLFLGLNEWLLRQSGASWDQPLPTKALLLQPHLRQLARQHLAMMISGPSSASFLGWLDYLRGQRLLNMQTPWGWKDPRNTFTLPIWLDLFPHARVVHVYRHGVDVASSLVRRTQGRADDMARRYRRRRLVYKFGVRRGGFTPSVRCSTLLGAFSLWEEYMNEARLHIGSRAVETMEVKYEDLLAEPTLHILRIAQFAGLPQPETLASSRWRDLERDRAYAFRRNAELAAFAQSVAPRLEALGYETPIVESQHRP